MSTNRGSKLTEMQRAVLYVNAGGRCEFPGCSKRVDQHEVLKQPAIHFEAAHNVASSPDGPRGDSERSHSLSNDLSNILLLCRDCHNGVDVRGHEIQFTEEQLRRFKERHEANVERLLSMDPHNTTVVVAVTGTIDVQASVFDEKALNRAVLECSNFERAPHRKTPTRVRLEDLDGKDGDPVHHTRSAVRISELLKREITNADGDDLPLSVFAIAPMCDLVQLGVALGNKRTIYHHQFAQETGQWSWRDMEARKHVIYDMSLEATSETDLALLIDLSGKVDRELVHRSIASMPQAVLSTREPGYTLIQSSQDIDNFSATWTMFLSRLGQMAPNVKRLHVFPAMPASLCVVIGQHLRAKQSPVVHWYDFSQRHDSGISEPMIIDVREE